VLGAGWTVEEVPAPKRALISLDDQRAPAGENKEVLLLVLPLVEPVRLSRLEHVEPDADLRELAHCALERAL